MFQLHFQLSHPSSASSDSSSASSLYARSARHSTFVQVHVGFTSDMMQRRIRRIHGRRSSNLIMISKSSIACECQFSKKKWINIHLLLFTFPLTYESIHILSRRLRFCPPLTSHRSAVVVALSFWLLGLVGCVFFHTLSISHETHVVYIIFTMLSCIEHEKSAHTPNGRRETSAKYKYVCACISNGMEVGRSIQWVSSSRWTVDEPTKTISKRSGLQVFGIFWESAAFHFVSSFLLILFLCAGWLWIEFALAKWRRKEKSPTKRCHLKSCVHVATTRAKSESDARARERETNGHK